MQITNAAKAAIIGAVNAVIALLPTVGITFHPHTEVKILVFTNVALAALTWFTRQLSPKWGNEVNVVVNDVVKAAEDISGAAAVIQAAAAALQSNAPAKVAAKKTA